MTPVLYLVFDFHLTGSLTENTVEQIVVDTVQFNARVI